MSRGLPEADDFTFTLTSADGVKYDAYIETIDGFHNHLEIDCRTRKVGQVGEWTWLIGYDVYGLDSLEGDDCDEVVKKAIAEVQESIKKVFGGESSPKPSGGKDRIDYIIKNQLTVVDNIISIKG